MLWCLVLDQTVHEAVKLVLKHAVSVVVVGQRQVCLLLHVNGRLHLLAFTDSHGGDLFLRGAHTAGAIIDLNGVVHHARALSWDCVDSVVVFLYRFRALRHCVVNWILRY